MVWTGELPFESITCDGVKAMVGMSAYAFVALARVYGKRDGKVLHDDFELFIARSDKLSSQLILPCKPHNSLVRAILTQLNGPVSDASCIPLNLAWTVLGDDHDTSGLWMVLMHKRLVDMALDLTNDESMSTRKCDLTRGQVLAHCLERTMYSPIYKEMYEDSGCLPPLNGHSYGMQPPAYLVLSMVRPVGDFLDQYATCAACGKVGTKDVPLMRCGRCCTHGYCSDECQRLHWERSHKKECCGWLSEMWGEFVLTGMDCGETAPRIAKHFIETTNRHRSVVARLL